MPYSISKPTDFYYLSQTKVLENHTLRSGKYDMVIHRAPASRLHNEFNFELKTTPGRPLSSASFLIHFYQTLFGKFVKSYTRMPSQLDHWRE